MDQSYTCLTCQRTFFGLGHPAWCGPVVRTKWVDAVQDGRRDEVPARILEQLEAALSDD